MSRLHFCIVAVVLFCVITAAPAVGQSPRYQVYQAHFPEIGGDAAEPSIGINWSTGNIMYQAGLETIRLSFDDDTSPAMTAWESTPSLLTSLFSLDPVLFTDRMTNRTFVSQLDAACSLTSFTDDDGRNWKLSVGCGIPAGLDHQSVGGGKYAFTPPLRLSTYPNAVYYCSQNLISAICSRSDDGGRLFGLGHIAYLFTQCGGRHGKIEVAPDGTVYLPNSACGSQQGVAVSTNNGATWTVRKIPGSTSAASDPSIGIGSNNKVYFGYQSADGKPRIAVSNDRGVTWTNHQSVGDSFGINNVVFPTVVAGDNNRAAFVFIGTTTAGNFGNSNFTGKWYLYVATTFDGGQTWTTVNGTPNDPVQIGSINIQEGVQPAARRLTTNMSIPLLDRGDRNLLDFIDAAVDKQGRLVVAYADGCINECMTSNNSSLSRSALASVLRQSGGKRLFSAFDPVEPAKPGAPLLMGTRAGSSVFLTWAPPDNGGSAITKYKVFRRTAATTFDAIGTVTTNSFLDNSATQGISYIYAVTAVNSIGASSKSNKLEL